MIELSYEAEVNDREKRRLLNGHVKLMTEGLKSLWTTPLSGEAQIKSITGELIQSGVTMIKYHTHLNFTVSKILYN